MTELRLPLRFRASGWPPVPALHGCDGHLPFTLPPAPRKPRLPPSPHPQLNAPHAALLESTPLPSSAADVSQRLPNHRDVLRSTFLKYYSEGIDILRRNASFAGGSRLLGAAPSWCFQLRLVPLLLAMPTQLPSHRGTCQDPQATLPGRVGSSHAEASASRLTPATYRHHLA